MDGGYLRWPSLVSCRVNHLDDDVNRFCKFLELVRKDVEATFGSLKKRFKCLKAWSEKRRLSTLEDEFVACCILHNILLKHDGYLDESYLPDNEFYTSGGLWWEVERSHQAPPAGASEDEDVSRENEVLWIERTEALASHWIHNF